MQEIESGGDSTNEAMNSAIQTDNKLAASAAVGFRSGQDKK
jgi:hypothetical protein